MRRVFSKPRISYSAWNMYKRGDYDGLFDYYNEIDTSNEKMKRGKFLHELAEITDMRAKLLEAGIKIGKYQQEYRFSIEKEKFIFVGVVDILTDDYIIDLKTGSTGGYGDQLNLYRIAMKEIDKKNRKMLTVGIDDDLNITKVVKNKEKKIDYEAEFNELADRILFMFRNKNENTQD